MREIAPSIRSYCRRSKEEKLIQSAIREPLWTNHEVEKFWLVLEPYMKQLIGGQRHLPETDLDLSELVQEKMSDFETCLLHIQELIWRGKYSLAVSDLRSVHKYFGHLDSERYKIRRSDGDLCVLRALFVRRVPRRKTLCQFKWNSI